MRAPIRASVLAAAVVAADLSSPPSALARAQADTYYTLSQTFGATLRYLRVDLGFDVTEKDPEAAYLLFRYRVPGEPKRDVAGAIELIKLDKRVRVLVKIPQMPELHERMLRDGLIKKLAQEYGEPARPAPDKPKDATPDAGSDSNSDK